MGDGDEIIDCAEDLIESESSKPMKCPYRDMRRDCDGDWDAYCHNWHGKCPYMKTVRDVDRDIVLLCRKWKISKREAWQISHASFCINTFINNSQILENKKSIITDWF